MLQPVLQSPLAPPLQAPIGDFGGSFVSRFGVGLSAAYFLADLGSKRGEVSEPDGGAFASTDGTDDKLIDKNIGVYKEGDEISISVWIRPTGGSLEVIPFTISTANNSALQMGSIPQNVWSEVTVLALDIEKLFGDNSGATINSIALGIDGAGNFHQCDFSDFRITLLSGEYLARYKLDEQSSGSLNGVTAVDSSGNGYDGTYVGGTGGSGAPVPYVNPVSRVRRDSDGGLRAFTAADIKSGTARDYVLDDTLIYDGVNMWFDGVDDYVAVSGMTATDDYFGACTITSTIYVNDPAELSAVYALGSGAYRLYIQNGTLRVNATNTEVAITKGLHTVVVTFDATGKGTNIGLNGSTTSIDAASPGNANSGTTFNIGARGDEPDLGLFFNGLITNLAITGSSVKNMAFEDGGVTTWTNGDGTGNGTVNGSPALYSGQPFGSVQAKFYDGLAGANDATQATVADMPKTVVAGARVVDGNGNDSTLWDGSDELTFTTAFTGLTAANVYAVTDNAGTVTLDTITDFDIRAITTMTALLTSLTYDKVTAVIIAPDNTDQAAIQSELNRIYGI